MNVVLLMKTLRMSVLAPVAALLGTAALSLLLAGGASAQESVLKSSEVTESTLIDALAVPAPQDEAAAGGATRGFRPANRQAAKPGAAPATPPRQTGPGRANLMITFQTDSANLTDESRHTLAIVARALQSDTLAGNTFRIEGHADARGDADYNLRLSQWRAEAVATYLVDQQGILPERLRAVGKGSSEPLNRSRVDAPENRRVTIVTDRP